MQTLKEEALLILIYFLTSGAGRRFPAANLLNAPRPDRPVLLATYLVEIVKTNNRKRRLLRMQTHSFIRNRQLMVTMTTSILFTRLRQAAQVKTEPRHTASLTALHFPI
jgi:hypothetical protein